jgi:hypothetical protein
MKGRRLRTQRPWVLCAVVWLVISGKPFAATPSSLAPDFLRLQFAGGSGFLSLGAGYSWWNGKVEAEAAYGFAPEAVAGIDLHILSQKNTLSPGRIRLAGPLFLDPFMTGFAANFAQGPRYEVLLPPHQRDYYWPDGLYFWYFAAAKLTYELENASIRSVAAALEAGTFNQYLRAYFSSEYVSIADILSLAISLRLYL